jgi:hypothetical protein
MLGPIDYIAVGFKGNNFDGSILEALAEATESGAIRVVDLVFIIKDSEGSIEIAEIEDQEDDLKQVSKLIGHSGDFPLLTENDINVLGEKMDNDTSAGVLVIEHLWAKNLKSALINASGILLDEGRIHPETVDLVIEEIKSSK